jgi:hypothetical protein
MIFILFTFLVAAAISSVAAYFSLVGLGSIYTATFWGVVIMAGTLEVGKIVATKWVYSNWRNPKNRWYFKSLICFFIACLMSITSLGIYGYLTRGHLEQQAPLAGLNIQVAQLESQVQQKQAENVRLDNRLNQITKVTDKVLEGNARAGLRASNASKTEAAGIQKTIDANNQTINDLTAKLVPLKVQGSDVQGELGVAKFIAEAFGWAPDKAIRIITSLIMATFDPLALTMFIMATISLEDYKRRKAALDTGRVLPFEELIVPMPPVSPPLSSEPEVQEPEPVVDMEALREEMFAGLAAELQAERTEKLEEIRRAIELEREDFEDEMHEVRQQTADMANLDEVRKEIERDHASLQTAHTQLVEMEARLDDERTLLQQWEDALKDQQQAINNWTPGSPEEDTRTPKEKIIEMLERNPDTLTEIIEMVDAMRPNRPGL